jgi:hypothetical protein
MSRVFLVSFLFFVLLLPREPWSGPARLDVTAARSLVARGNLDVAGETTGDTWVHAGRRWAREPLGPTLALAPLEGALLLAPRTEGGARVSRLAEAVFAAALAALLCALFFAAATGLGVRRRSAWVATLALAASTTVAVYARIPDGSLFAALLLLYGFEAARRFSREPTSRRALALGAACAGLLLFDLAAPSLVLLGFAVALAPSRRPLGWALAPIIAASALVLWHQRAAALLPEARGDLIEGLDGLLISTGKSVFAYSPPLLLSLFALPSFWREHRSHAVLLVAVAAAVILPAAGLERWDADPAWGPRRLVPLVPLFLLPAVPWIDKASRAASRVLLATVLAVGLSVQLLGAAFPPETYLRILAVVKNGSGASGWFAVPDQAHFMPQFSPLSGHAWLLSHLYRHDKKLEQKTPWTLLVPATPKLESEWPRVRLDWWALSLSRDTVSK